MTSAAAYLVSPTMSIYSLSKLVMLQIQAFVAVENPNVTSTALHPGIVMTDMAMGVFKPFAQDTPAVVGLFELGSRMRKQNS